MIYVTIGLGQGYGEEFESLAAALGYAVDEVAKHLQREVNELGEWELDGVTAEDDDGNMYRMEPCDVNEFKWTLETDASASPSIPFNEDSGRFPVLIDVERSPT